MAERLERAGEQDAGWLRDLVRHEAVEPFLSVTAAEGVETALEDFWLLRGGGERLAAGRLTVVHAPSRIADVRSLVVEPGRRGEGLGLLMLEALTALAFGDHGLHRVQAEVYAFNTGARRTFERAGFTREGVRRQAYHRAGRWQDSVLYGRLDDD